MSVISLSLSRRGLASRCAGLTISEYENGDGRFSAGVECGHDDAAASGASSEQEEGGTARMQIRCNNGWPAKMGRTREWGDSVATSHSRPTNERTVSLQSVKEHPPLLSSPRLASLHPPLFFWLLSQGASRRGRRRLATGTLHSCSRVERALPIEIERDLPIEQLRCSNSSALASVVVRMRRLAIDFRSLQLFNNFRVSNLQTMFQHRKGASERCAAGVICKAIPRT